MTAGDKLEIRLREYIDKIEGKKNIDAVFQELGLSGSDKIAFDEVIDRLSKDLVIICQGNKIGKPASFNCVVGIIEITQRGFGFVDPEDKQHYQNSIFIPQGDTNNAITGDRVLVKISDSKKKGADLKLEGRVVKIVAKGNRIISGIIQRNYYDPNTFMVKTMDLPMHILVYVDGSYENLSVDDSVICEINEVEEGKCKCRIIENLGSINKPGVDINTILTVYGIADKFPEEVIKEALSLPKVLSTEMIEEELRHGRRDLRSILTVTIDGADTKDVDDAVTIQELENGNYMLGVHIADVTHYVKHGSALDQEAYKRGTSVYPVGRVVPMLPKELSNGICSLNKNTDRFALSVMMEIDRAGNVIDNDIFESVINVDYSITYDEVYRLFTEPDYDLLKKFGERLDQLTKMKELASLLNQKRKARGSIDFNIPETKVLLNDEGYPVSVSAYRTTFANNIIEEFMLLCNETVAERFFWYNIPFMYRVHDEPSQEKMQELSVVVTNLGYPFKNTSKYHPKMLQKLLDATKGKPEERIIASKVLRSMQKAEYRSTNDGHFGLSLQYYTHFTSPIRRYPDLFIHRMIKYTLHGEMTPDREQYFNSILSEYAKHCSVTERNAAEAERECTDLKCAEYMKQYINKTFTGIVSGITDFGIFIELENTVQGLARYQLMHDYYYVTNAYTAAIGEDFGNEFKIGSEVTVTVESVNIPLRQIEFMLHEHDNKKKKNKKRR